MRGKRLLDFSGIRVLVRRIMVICTLFVCVGGVNFKNQNSLIQIHRHLFNELGLFSSR
jgi:hypothetical protein